MTGKETEVLADAAAPATVVVLADDIREEKKDVAMPLVDETTDVNDLPEDDRPVVLKRGARTAILHLCIFLIMSAYMGVFIAKGQGKIGYEFGIVVYVFVSLRLLAQNVSIAHFVYKPLGQVFELCFGWIPRTIPETLQMPILGALLLVAFVLTAVLSPSTETGSVAQRFQSLAGLVFLIGVLYACSADRNAIKWRTVVVGLVLQFLIGLFILRTTLGVNIFNFISTMITAFLQESVNGLEFLFGPTESNPFKFTFAVAVLPAIVFFCSFITIVYYLGGMQYIVMKFAWVMVRLMDTSGGESVVAAASPFVGQGESALMVKPFIEYMTMAELHSTMTSGFATIAGSVLLAYIGYTGNTASATSALLTACVMSVPCSLLVSKMILPEKEESLTRGHVKIPPSEEKDVNFLHAAGNGAALGIQLILLISGALLAVVSLYHTADFLCGFFFDMIGVRNQMDGDVPVSIQFILSYIFTPIAIAIGIVPSESRKAAEFMATKMVVNEFVAYANLNGYAFQHQANGTAVLYPDGSGIPTGSFNTRTLRLLSFALCGFANFASIGIQIGCLGAMAPSRRKDLAKLALSAMLCGTMSTWITAAVAGILI